MIRTLAGILVLAGTGLTVAAAGVAMDAGKNPDAVWTIETNRQDTVRISGQDGILTVDYDVEVNRTHQIGHQTFNQVPFRLMLKKPVAMDADQRRIIFQASGLLMVDKDHARHLLIAPIIRDENGELLIYNPTKLPHLNSGGETWSSWMTRDFFSGEAGGAAHSIFEADGGDRNAWPDGKLAFAGFQINVRNPEFGRRKGSFHIGTISSGGVKIPLSTPFAYADSFLKKKGVYKLAAVVRNQFQGIPVREISRQIDFDPDSPGSCRQRLEIPLGPVDNYWIDYQITDAAGKAIESDFMRYEVVDTTDKTNLQPVDTQKPPVLGYLRINADKPGNGVYKRDEPFDVQVRVFPKKASRLQLSWDLSAWSYPGSLDRGQCDVSFNGQDYQDIVVSLRRASDMDAYKLTLKVRNKGKVVDTRTYCLGYQTDMSKSRDRAGKMANRDDIKKHAYNRTTYLSKYRDKKKPTFQEELESVREFLENSKFMTDSFTYMVDLANFEVLPGVFDFSMLDRVLDLAADYGCKVTVRVAHADTHGLYLWPKYSRQYSYDGSLIGVRYYGGYAISDPRLIELWLNSYRALYERYQKHTAFQGYYVMQPSGEWSVLDKPWEGCVAGYSEPAIAGLRNFLKENMKLTLPELNRRWNTSYRSWDEVTAPQPSFQMGVNPDLSMRWVDFCRFKSALGREVWFPLAINSIREYDPDRITIIYGNPKTSMPLAGKLDYCHNGGNHQGNNLGQYADAWQKGKIGWITEPHHPHNWAAYGDPAEKGWVLDWSVWVMTAQAGGGGANLHVYYKPYPKMQLASLYGGDKAYDRFEMYKPILEELHTFKLQEPPVQVATLQDSYTLYCKHRTTFGARKEDLKRWFGLLEEDSIAAEEFSPERVANYKLLIPNILDEVMSEENIDLLDRAVRDGAKMVICANTGKYCPERGESPFQLLKALGITSPRGAYISSRENISANVTVANPLFAEGDKLAFFSLADFQSDLQSDEIKKNFWQYPYRWIPQTDYFGYYPDTKQTNGTVLARFPEGGVALSQHNIGKGEVIVFWGTPDVRDNKLKGLMEKTAIWADAVSPRRGSPIPKTIEGHSDELKRHYALMYQETPGAYTQKLTTVPDGTWFLSDLVAQQKLGLYTGKELRENGLPVTYVEGCSPLKVIRMMPVEKRSKIRWIKKYRTLSGSGQ
jgi:hypothetical protein